jgi:uncharacterized protein YbgA (DUF1722 family)
MRLGALSDMLIFLLYFHVQKKLVLSCSSEIEIRQLPPFLVQDQKNRPSDSSLLLIIVAIAEAFIRLGRLHSSSDRI